MTKEFKVSIHKLNNGKFQASYFNPINHKRQRFKFSSKKEALGFKKQQEQKCQISFLS